MTDKPGRMGRRGRKRQGSAFGDILELLFLPLVWLVRRCGVRRQWAGQEEVTLLSVAGMEAAPLCAIAETTKLQDLRRIGSDGCINR